MKKNTKQTLLVAALLGSIATSSMAEGYAYDIDFKAASVQKSDFNPYWFEEKEAVQVQEYAYDIDFKDASVKKADINPYWFEN